MTDPFGVADSLRPVTGVVWADAAAYCKWRYGERGRLPTEEEWEAAAHGVPDPSAPGRSTGARANVASAKRNSIAPVGSFPLGATPGGVQDLIGNVWEWTSSPMIAYLGGRPLADSLRRYLVIRGGAFDTPGRSATIWLRGYSLPALAPAELSNTGFRCVR